MPAVGTGVHAAGTLDEADEADDYEYEYYRHFL